MNEREFSKTNITGGFRFYKLNNTHGIFVMRNYIYIIYLEEIGRSKFNLNLQIEELNLDSFYPEMDLFDYKSNFLFTWEKNDFMRKNNIYFFRIYNFNSKNHYKFYDYKEKKIKKMLCYYNQSNDNIAVIYQSSNNIKFFYMKYIRQFLDFNSISRTIEMKTYEKIKYNVSELINEYSRIGKLNVEGIMEKNYNLGLISTENFGINFYELLMNDNTLIPEKSFNSLYKYDLAFIDHVENEYTRIYYLNDVNIYVKTCFYDNCISCWENYNQCDTYGNGDYALLIDDNTKGYPTTKLLKGSFTIFAPRILLSDVYVG